MAKQIREYRLSDTFGAGNYNDLTDKPTIPVNSDFTLNGLSEKSYNNLTDKPTIPTVSDTAYDATSWNDNTDAPTKNAVRDKFESLTSGGLTQPQIMARTLGC